MAGCLTRLEASNSSQFRARSSQGCKSQAEAATFPQTKVSNLPDSRTSCWGSPEWLYESCAKFVQKKEMGLHELFSLEMQTLDDRASELGHSILVTFLYDFLYIITVWLLRCQKQWLILVSLLHVLEFCYRLIYKWEHSQTTLICHLKCDMRGE